MRILGWRTLLQDTLVVPRDFILQLRANPKMMIISANNGICAFRLYVWIQVLGNGCARGWQKRHEGLARISQSDRAIQMSEIILFRLASNKHMYMCSAADNGIGKSVYVCLCFYCFMTQHILLLSWSWLRCGSDSTGWHSLGDILKCNQIYCFYTLNIFNCSYIDLKTIVLTKYIYFIIQKLSNTVARVVEMSSKLRTCYVTYASCLTAHRCARHSRTIHIFLHNKGSGTTSLIASWQIEKQHYQTYGHEHAPHAFRADNVYTKLRDTYTNTQ